MPHRHRLGNGILSRSANSARRAILNTSWLTTELTNTKKIASAKRSRVSIRDLPRNIWLDHPAKFGCCFLICVRTCRRSQKFWRRWAPLPWDGRAWWTLKCFSPPVTMPNLVILCQQYKRNYGDPPERKYPSHPASRSPRSLEPGGIDRLPMTSY